MVRNLKQIALIVIVLMIGIGCAAPVLRPFDPHDFSARPLTPPNSIHLLGTNTMGQDNFSALIAGFRISLLIAISAAFFSTGIGLLLAVIAAYYRGWLEKIITSVTELFIIIPDVILVMLFATFAGANTRNVVLVMVFFSWSRIARVLRNKATIIINQDNIQYTVLLKGTIFDVSKKMWKQLYPAVITLFVQQCGTAVTYEAVLSFMGVGDPTLKSWGKTIRDALNYDGIFWDGSYQWWLLPPLISLLVLILALSLLAFDFEKFEKFKKKIGG